MRAGRRPPVQVAVRALSVFQAWLDARGSAACRRSGDPAYLAGLPDPERMRTCAAPGTRAGGYVTISVGDNARSEQFVRVLDSTFTSSHTGHVRSYRGRVGR